MGSNPGRSGSVSPNPCFRKLESSGPGHPPTGFTQSELVKKAGTTPWAIAGFEDAEYTGGSLILLTRMATACGVAAKLWAEKKPDFDREAALVQMGGADGMSHP